MEYNVLTICSPERGQYNDFTLGNWPESVIASYHLWGYNPEDSNAIWRKEPYKWTILDNEAANVT